VWEGDIIDGVIGEPAMGTAESQNLCMSGNSKRENREVPSACESLDSERSENASGGTADMHADGKSDGFVVPAKRASTKETSAQLGDERFVFEIKKLHGHIEILAISRSTITPLRIVFRSVRRRVAVRRVGVD
jgi:hypothetical protein